MYESYSLAVAESSVKQNPENRLKITKSLWLGAVWEPWGLGLREATLQGPRALSRQGWGLGHPEQEALPRSWWASLVAQQQRIHLFAGSISGLGRSPGSRNDNLLHYSYLKNPMDREALQAMGSQRVRHNWSNLAAAIIKKETRQWTELHISNTIL